MQKKHIGIYGGSFNPIHNGHIAIARKMLVMAGLDEIWFVVSPHNPLKKVDTLMPDSLRLEMTQRALAPYPGLRASDFEFHLPRPSYMWNTLQALSSQYTDCEFTLLIGADNWAVFDRWYHATDIIAHYPIAIYPRTGSPIDTTTLPPTVRLYDTGLYDISSTEVRAALKAGKDVSLMVPKEIYDLL